jgi:hypothetical protein
MSCYLFRLRIPRSIHPRYLMGGGACLLSLLRCRVPALSPGTRLFMISLCEPITAAYSWLCAPILEMRVGRKSELGGRYQEEIYL